MSVYAKLINVQNELKAPKSQFNSFGKYNYRSCEDILEALKPVCQKYKAVTMISDSVEVIGTRQYVKATVTFIDIETGEKVTVDALAREEENKKGMDSSQVTGATSSYARKYALNGMFCIDDTKDSDATNTHGKEETTNGNTNNRPSNNAAANNKPTTNKLSDAQFKRLYVIAKTAGYDYKHVARHVMKKYNKQVEEINKAEYDEMCEGYEKVSNKEVG